MRNQPINHRKDCGLCRRGMGSLLVCLTMYGIAGPLNPVAAIHVPSTAGTGSITLDQLAERALRFGIDAVILSENFTHPRRKPRLTWSIDTFVHWWMCSVFQKSS